MCHLHCPTASGVQGVRARQPGWAQTHLPGTAPSPPTPAGWLAASLVAKVVKSFLHKLAYINRLKDKISLLSLPCGLMRDFCSSPSPVVFGKCSDFGKYLLESHCLQISGLQDCEFTSAAIRHARTALVSISSFVPVGTPRTRTGQELSLSPFTWLP